MNSKGQYGIFFPFMIGITMFILGFALAPALVTNAANVMGVLACSTTTVTATKIVCGIVDVSAPWIVGLIMGLGGLALGAKLG